MFKWIGNIGVSALAYGDWQQFVEVGICHRALRTANNSNTTAVRFRKCAKECRNAADRAREINREANSIDIAQELNPDLVDDCNRPPGQKLGN